MPEKLFCLKCRAELEPDSAFCRVCGTRVIHPVPKPEKRFCWKCGAEAAEDSDFCFKCGAKLSGTTGTAQANNPGQNAFPGANIPVYAPPTSVPPAPQKPQKFNHLVWIIPVSVSIAVLGAVLAFKLTREKPDTDIPAIEEQSSVPAAQPVSSAPAAVSSKPQEAPPEMSQPPQVSQPQETSKPQPAPKQRVYACDLNGMTIGGVKKKYNVSVVRQSGFEGSVVLYFMTADGEDWDFELLVELSQTIQPGNVVPDSAIVSYAFLGDGAYLTEDVYCGMTYSQMKSVLGSSLGEMTRNEMDGGYSAYIQFGTYSARIFWWNTSDSPCDMITVYYGSPEYSGGGGDENYEERTAFRYTTDFLNMRTAASKSASIILVIEKDKPVLIYPDETEYNDGLWWVKAKYNGQTGWVCSDYLS